MDLVGADLTRANERVATVERRNVGSLVAGRNVLIDLSNRSCCDQRSRPFEVARLRLSGARSWLPEY